jgi:hypothetical protein
VVLYCKHDGADIGLETHLLFCRTIADADLIVHEHLGYYIMVMMQTIQGHMWYHSVDEIMWNWYTDTCLVLYST